MQSYLIKSTLIFTTALLIAGCQNYQSRHEGYSISAGDAQAINEAKMVEDPWKKSADNNQINSDGKRLGDAVKRYKNGHANSEEVTASNAAEGLISN